MGAEEVSEVIVRHNENSAVPEPPAPRGPGRPIGKPKTGGRKKGIPNKVTREIREIAAKYTTRAVRAAWELATNAESEETRLKALALILSYGHGKPTQRTEVGGIEGGDPIAVAKAEPASTEAWDRVGRALRGAGANNA